MESVSVMSEKTNHAFEIASNVAGSDVCASSVGTSTADTGAPKFACGVVVAVVTTAVIAAGTQRKRSSPKNQNAGGNALVNWPLSPSILDSIPR